MNIKSLVEEITDGGYVLHVYDKSLICRGKEPLAGRLMEKLKEHKQEVISFLLESQAGDRLPEIKPDGKLLVPFDCQLRYRWWDDRVQGRLTLKQIRAELERNALN